MALNMVAIDILSVGRQVYIVHEDNTTIPVCKTVNHVDHDFTVFLWKTISNVKYAINTICENHQANTEQLQIRGTRQQ